jgi:hypothetical protein
MSKLSQIQSRQRPSGDLKLKPHAQRDLLDVPCTYHKGARHTLCEYHLRKSSTKSGSPALHKLFRPGIVESSRRSGSTSPPNDSGSIFRRVLVVSENKPPCHNTTDSKESARIQGNILHAQQHAKEHHRMMPACARDLRLEFEEAGLLTFNSPKANLGTDVARLQQANLTPEAKVTMAYLRVSTALVEENIGVVKSATSSSSHHLHSQSH